MSLFDILQAFNRKVMYTDRMTVYRQIPVVDEQGADDFVLQAVYEDVPCRLAQSQKARLSIGSGAAESMQQLKVFAAPELTVFANDVIEVRRMERMYRMRASLPFFYSTHQEIPVDVDESARQEEAIDNDLGGL